jgi:membrane protein implicated in regulation of membrane protease activity
MAGFTEFSALTAFLIIAGLGFAFLLISLVFGEIFEVFEHGTDGAGFFSTRVLSVFITAFGATGAIATHYGASAVWASMAGLASGFFFASIIYFFARFLHNQQASTEIRTDDLVGITARVIIRIPPEGVGQIRCRLGEDLVDKIARSGDGEAIPENSAVQIESVLGETVVVRRALNPER